MARESFRATPADRRNMVKLPDSVDDLPERTVIDLNSKTPGVPITIIDDTPEDDQGRPTELEYSEADQEQDAADADLSARTKKRIDRLRFETHTERRAREAAERERDAATALAVSQREELDRLRKVAETGSVALANSMKAEREQRRDEAQRRLEQAYADGDAAAQAKATADLSLANAELVQIAARTPAPKTEVERQPTPVPQPQQQQRAELKPNVAAYLSHHRDWFNKDRQKTELAMSIHRTLMARGVNDASAEYTRELDKGLKAVYPDHKPFESSNATTTERDAPRRTNGVSEGSREDGVNRPALREGQVELTRSEVALAQRMKVPLDKYAEEKQRRIQKEGKGA